MPSFFADCQNELGSSLKSPPLLPLCSITHPGPLHGQHADLGWDARARRPLQDPGRPGGRVRRERGMVHLRLDIGWVMVFFIKNWREHET